MDVVDDWENADIDDMASKIAAKEIVSATAGSKIVRKDEEDNEDLDTTVSSKDSRIGKDAAKLKNAIK